jgi:nitrite reductase (NADH) small subunit
MGKPVSLLLLTTEVNLGDVAQIPLGEGREFWVLERRIVVFHLSNGQVYATQANCPHEEARLKDGLVSNHILVCPLHAWKFDLRTGQPLVGDCGLQIYPVHVNKDRQIILLI